MQAVSTVVRARRPYALPAGAGIIALAFALRVWDLSARSLWLDEAMEFWNAVSIDLTNVKSLIVGDDPPMYSLLLHGWMQLGQNEWMLRFPSVCCSVLTVAGLMLLGRRMFGTGAGLLAGLFGALLPTEIRYAQEAGQYAPLVALITWSLVYLERAARARQWRHYALWVTAAAAGAYMHYGAMVGILPPMGYLLMRDALRKDRRALLKDCAALLMYVLTIAPLFVFLLPAQLFRGARVQAFHLSFQSPIVELTSFLQATGQLIGFVLTGFPWTIVPDWLPVVAAVAAALPVLVVLVRQRSGPTAMLFGWLAFTSASYYALSRLNAYPYGFRYALILTPPLLLLLGHGIAALLARRDLRLPGSGIAVALAAMFIVSLPNRTWRDNGFADMNWLWPETTDLREATNYWLQHDTAHDPLFVYYIEVPGFRYYLHLAGLDGPALPAGWYTACWTQPLDYCTSGDVHYGKWLRAMAPDTKIESIGNTLGVLPPHWWIIFSGIYPGEDRAILDKLDTTYRIGQSITRSSAAVYEFVKR